MIRCVERSPDEREGQGQERLVPQRLLFWSIVMCLFAAALATILSIVFYYLLLRPSGPIVSGNISQLTEIGKVSLAVVAGLGGIVALVTSFKRQRLSEFSHKIAVSSMERDRQRVLNERFASAVAQLGDSSSAAVRIGGVYSLAKLADDWPSDRQRCIDVLCAYLRFPLKDSDEKADEAEVRRTLSSVIQEHLNADAPIPWTNNTFNLRGASLDGLSLANIVLTDGVLILANCSVTTGTFDLSGIFLDGTVDATGLTMTGGKIDLRNAKIRGGQLLFKGAHFNGGNLSLVDSIAGRICFDGSEIDGGELDLSGLQIWCHDKKFSYNAGISFNELEIAKGLLNLKYSELVTVDTELLQPDDTDANDYVVIKMEDATMTGGRISLRETRLVFGEHSFRRLKISGGVLDCSRTTIYKRAQIQLEGLEMRGGHIDFSNACIGSPPHEEVPDVGNSWVQNLQKGKSVGSRNVVWVNPHPPGHIDLSCSEIEAGLVTFEYSELNGAIVLLYGLNMSGGRIGFDSCISTKAVVSLWNVDLQADAIIDFEQSFEPPVIIYSQYHGGLGKHVHLHEHSCLLEVSPRD
jgi:hypothetical protein